MPAVDDVGGPLMRGADRRLAADAVAVAKEPQAQAGRIVARHPKQNPPAGKKSSSRAAGGLRARHSVRSDALDDRRRLPIPPPMHMVMSPVVLLRRSSSSRTVPISMAPVAPERMAERDGAAVDVHADRDPCRQSRIDFKGTVANASLISIRSMSLMVMPAFFRQRSVAGTGAVNMITGSAP